jgi:hypothetical protein
LVAVPKALPEFQRTRGSFGSNTFCEKATAMHNNVLIVERSKAFFIKKQLKRYCKR